MRDLTCIVQCSEHAPSIATSKGRVDAPSRPVPTRTDQTRPTRPFTLTERELPETSTSFFLDAPWLRARGREAAA